MSLPEQLGRLWKPPASGFLTPEQTGSESSGSIVRALMAGNGFLVASRALSLRDFTHLSWLHSLEAEQVSVPFERGAQKGTQTPNVV